MITFKFCRLNCWRWIGGLVFGDVIARMFVARRHRTHTHSDESSDLWGDFFMEFALVTYFLREKRPWRERARPDRQDAAVYLGTLLTTYKYRKSNSSISVLFIWKMGFLHENVCDTWQSFGLYQFYWESEILRRVPGLEFLSVFIIEYFPLTRYLFRALFHISSRQKKILPPLIAFKITPLRSVCKRHLFCSILSV